jgi:hypothetical protein
MGNRYKKFERIKKLKKKVVPGTRTIRKEKKRYEDLAFNKINTRNENKIYNK